MLVYITNRKLSKIPDTKPASNRLSEIGSKLNTRTNQYGDAIFSGISSTNNSSIKFYPRGQEQDLFDSIDPAEYKKPWTVLLHGFHQDVNETIKKAQFLVDHQGVNVVLFSWPSHPDPVKSFDASTLKDYIRDYVKTVLFKLGRPSLATLFVGELGKWLRDFVSNYVPARNNAEASTTDFYNALEMLHKNLLPRVPGNKVSLLVHSMGNYLLQNTINDKRYLPMKFTNIILHQADVEASTHAAWVPKLTSSATGGVYITVNVFDYVLAASNILHRYRLGNKNVERLGQSVRVKPDGVYQGYIHGIVNYLDFTDGFGIESGHEIFTCTGIDIGRDPIRAGKNDVDDKIFHLIGRIIRSESKDGLPAGPGYGKQGISRMSTLANIFKPRWIVEDDSLCDDEESVCFLDSYQDYTDPYRPEPEVIPALEDY